MFSRLSISCFQVREIQPYHIPSAFEVVITVYEHPFDVRKCSRIRSVIMYVVDFPYSNVQCAMGMVRGAFSGA